MIIRSLVSQDRKGWEKLYRGYAGFYKTQMTEAKLETVWSWLNDTAHPLEGRVAEDHGPLVGLIHFRPMPSPLRGQDVGFLDDLFVSPDARGGAVAEALLAHLK